MKVLHYILTVILLLGLVACRDNRSDDLWEDRILGDSLYVQLTLDLLNSSNATRAVPDGGEEGDGWRSGHSYENQLHNFSVFVLGNNATINSSYNTPFVGIRYFSDEEVARVDSIYQENLRLKNYDVLKNVTTYKFTIPILHEKAATMPAAETFRFIVVANQGDLTQTYHTLGALRDGRPNKTWTDSSTGPERFVMSNENDQFHSSGTGTENDPIRLHVTIERMAARIDFDPSGSEKVGDALCYPLKGKDADQTLLANLYVDRMAIVNGSQQPSYYIKRVADDFNGTNLTYLGDETPAPRGLATNYVIDPNSSQKIETNRTNNEFLTGLFGNSRISNVSALLASDAALLPTITSTETPVTVGYVNENTYAPDMATSEYTTGIVLQCRFAPKHNFYTDYNADTDALTEGVYELGTTFYMVEPNIPEIDESQRLYFLNEDDANAYASNTAKKHFCKVVKYENGICYYFIYMRHSNSVEVIHDTMEFGIVRNNIYRFSINATTGPGTPTPDPRHPEELKARIYVKKWISVEHPIIYV